MNNSKVKVALQDLIIRLQDAEKGYKEVEKATSIVPLKRWMNKYAEERHAFHRELEAHVALLGGDAEVKTSFLGDLHRMFIDVKVNNTSWANEFDAIITEIERGSARLIAEYEKVLTEVKLSATLAKTLFSQKEAIQREVSSMSHLQEELSSVEA